MSAAFKLSALAGAIALVAGGSAMANTTVDSTATGDLFLNIIDNSNTTSFFYDTGISQASFNGSTTSFNKSLLSDPNYQAFVAGEGAGDSIDYSVISATKNSTPPATATIYFTSNSGPAPVTGSAISQTQGQITGFLTGANRTTSQTTNSALLTAFDAYNGGGAWEAGVVQNLGMVNNGPNTGDNASIGTALNFYGETSSSLRSTTALATLTTFAGQWNLSGGTLSYAAAPTSAVPLPTPLLLLLSGLGVMGVVARRGKPTETAA